MGVILGQVVWGVHVPAEHHYGLRAGPRNHAFGTYLVGALLMSEGVLPYSKPLGSSVCILRSLKSTALLCKNGSELFQGVHAAMWYVHWPLKGMLCHDLWTNIHIYTHTLTCVCIYKYTYCIYIYIYVHIHGIDTYDILSTYTRKCVHMYICIYIYIEYVSACIFPYGVSIWILQGSSHEGLGYS